MAQSALPAPLRAWLRAEGCAAFALALALYARSGGDWRWFALFFLAPDLSMIAYWRGPALGALGYNLAHSYLGPALLAAGGLAGAHGALPAALIWAAHIGFDRALGYGLKDRVGFGFTHLGRIGVANAARAAAGE